MSTFIKPRNHGRLFPGILSDFFDSEKFFSPEWFGQSVPAVNIKENQQQFNIELAVPGFSKDDFKIKIENNVLSISAEKKEEKEDDNERFTRKEYAYHSFSRSFTLPQNSDSNKIDATYEHGILKLILPKREKQELPEAKEIKVA